MLQSKPGDLSCSMRGRREEIEKERRNQTERQKRIKE
jgi:hypothetical protein